MSVRFKRSYRDRKQAVAKRKKTIIKVLIIVFSFQIIFTVFISTIKMSSKSMEPSLDAGNVMIYSPVTYGFKINSLNKRLPQFSSPERGDLVVFTPPYILDSKGVINVISSAVKFLTFGKIDLKNFSSDKDNNKYLIKRVIAVPGDTIKMTNFTAFVKSAASEYFLSEFEVVNSNYDISVGILPEGWNATMPFSGNMEELTLEDNEYFVLGDNRMLSSDSTNWGTLDKERIIGKVLLNYWPLSKFRILK